MNDIKTVDTIIHAQAIVTVNQANAILPLHSIIICAGKIRDILPTDDAQKQYQSSNTLDLSQHVLMPGLINAHGHAAMSLMRGFADDLPLMDWRNEHIWPAEAALVSSEFVYDGT